MKQTIQTLAGAFAVALIATVLGLTGCSKSNQPGSESGTEGNAQTQSSNSDKAETPEQVDYIFGVIAKSQSNPVFQAAHTGAMDAARDIEKAHPDVNIDIRWKTPADEDAQMQAQNLAQLVDAGANGVTISCTDASLLTPAINDAVDKGTEVVCFDSDAPKSKRFAYYGIDDNQAGHAIMKHLAKAMGDKGVVAILAGNQTAPNLQARVKGVIDEAKNYPDIEVKYTFYHPETAVDAANKVQQEQQAHPDITGWAMVGGWPLFTTNALDGVYEVAKVVSVDHLPEELDYVRKGQVQALLGQDCYGWGYKTVMMLFDKVHDGKTPEKVINTFDLQVVTKDNVEEYEGIWKKWLGKE